PAEDILAVSAVARKRVGVGVEYIALDREMVGLALEVGAEAGLPALVAIVDWSADAGGQAVVLMIVGIDAHRARLAKGKPLSDGRRDLVGSRRAANQRPDRVAGVFAGDVDDAIDGVGPIERSAGSA